VHSISFTSDIQRPEELSIFSEHLIKDDEIVSWAYQNNPHSVIWCATASGKLYGLTFVREQEVMAWHRHDIGGDGLVRSVAVVPEGEDDALYAVIERNTLSAYDEDPVFSVERMASQSTVNSRHYPGSDSSVAWNNWRSDANKTGWLKVNQISGGGYDPGSLVTVTTELPWFEKSLSYVKETPGYYTLTNADEDAIERYNAASAPWIGPKSANYNDPNAYDARGRMSFSASALTGGRQNLSPQLLQAMKEGHTRAGMKVAWGGVVKETITPTSGSVGQKIRTGKWQASKTAEANLIVKSVVDKNTAICQVDYVAVPVARRGNVAINVWSLAGMNMLNDFITITDASGTPWIAGNSVTITAECDVWAYLNTAQTVGSTIVVGNPNAIECTLTITSAASQRVATATLGSALPSEYRATATYKWGRGAVVVSGLAHLNGENVSVYCDGAVVASPNNDNYATATVANNKITLTTPTVAGCIGLPFTCDIETLDIDSPDATSVGDANILVNRVVSHLRNAQGGYIGASLPDALVSLSNMVPINLDNPGTTHTSTERQEGKFSSVISSDWGTNGKVAIRHVDPSPMQVLSISPQVSISKRGNPR
jgi:hypothetical protein